jgi:hypothetical protein
VAEFTVELERAEPAADDLHVHVHRKRAVAVVEEGAARRDSGDRAAEQLNPPEPALDEGLVIRQRQSPRA